MFNRFAAHGAAPALGDALPDVGLYVDDERSIAAVSRPSRANPSLHVASLHHTVLYVHSDGSASLGGTDDPNAPEFTGFVAEDAPSGFEPGDLVAMTWRCLLVEVAQSVGTDPSFLAAAATFPATWTAEYIAHVRTAMNRYGLDHVALVSESEALDAWASTTQATWAGSDSGIAAARGAASIASDYPVDAVTEEIPVVRPVGPLWTRTPILAAVAFAGVLAFGGAVAASFLVDSSTPTLPQIEGAPAPDPSTQASAPTTLVPFPTVVPIAEPVVPEPAFVPVPATTEPAPTPETTADAIPRTRPASEAEEPTERPTSAPTPIDDPEENAGGEPGTGAPGDTDSGDTDSGGTDSGGTDSGNTDTGNTDTGTSEPSETGPAGG